MSLRVQLSALLVAGALLSGTAAAESLTIEAGKSAPVRLKGAAVSVVLGNKSIADVSVHDENLIFVTGKTYGSTNLLVFDRDGSQIYQTDIVVTSASGDVVTIVRSGDVSMVECAPSCRVVTAPVAVLPPG